MSTNPAPVAPPSDASLRPDWRTQLLMPLVAVSAIGLVVALAMRSMGRAWFCACETPRFWVGSAWSRHTSQHLLDPYSFTHVAHGFVFFFALAALATWLGRGSRFAGRTQLFVVAMLIEAAWEILENSPIIIDRYRAATASLDYTGDSVVNAMGDLLACAAGYVLASRLGLVRTLAVFVVFEVVLLFTIRDNLSLNVLMLLAPVDAIKQWQVGAAG